MVVMGEAERLDPSQFIWVALSAICSSHNQRCPSPRAFQQSRRVILTRPFLLSFITNTGSGPPETPPLLETCELTHSDTYTTTDLWESPFVSQKSIQRSVRRLNCTR
jgi:hypothetical protein